VRWPSGQALGGLVCVATLFACPVVLAAGAGVVLIRKVDVTRHDQCMRAAPKNPRRFRARQEYCDR
jgi:hypothetical protein